MTLCDTTPQSSVTTIILYRTVTIHIRTFHVDSSSNHVHVTILSIGMEQIIHSGDGRAQVQSVLLLTDGLANDGIKHMDGILAEMTKLQNPTTQADKPQMVCKQWDKFKYIQYVIMTVCL